MKPEHYSPARRRVASWRPASARFPCPICNKDSWCRVSDDGRLVICQRGGSHPDYVESRKGERRDRAGQPYRVYRSLRDAVKFVPGDRLPEPPADRADCSGLAEQLAAHLGDEQAAALVRSLGLPAWVKDLLPAFGVGYLAKAGKKRAAWTIPERDGTGKVVGIACRHPRGEPNKSMVRDTHHGLVYAPGLLWKLASETGVIHLVEGFSDVLAMTAAGLAAVGRFSCYGGAADLTVLLRTMPGGTRVVVVGENDSKPDGAWRGRDGAFRLARDLTSTLGRNAWWAVPPRRYKDARDAITSRAGPEAGRRRLATVGRELADHLTATAAPGEDPSLLAEVVEGMRADYPVSPCLHCYRQMNIGKPTSPRAGQYVAMNLECDKWTCPACGEKKAYTAICDSGERLAEYVDPDWGGGDAVAAGEASWPSDPGHLRQTGPWNLFAWFVPESRREWLVRAIGRVKSERAVVWTDATPDDLDAAAGRNLGFKTGEKTDTPHPPKAEVSAPGERWCLILAVIHPKYDPPRGAVPVGPIEWVRLYGAALRLRPRHLTGEAVRLRVDFRTAGLKVSDDENTATMWRGWPLAYKAESIRKITNELGITAPGQVGGRKVMKSTIWQSGSAFLNWAFGRLVGVPKSGPVEPPASIVAAYRRWDAAIRPLLKAGVVREGRDGRPGSAVAHLIDLYLWSGPPPGFAEDVAEAVAADEKVWESEDSARGLHAEAREIIDGLRRGYAGRLADMSPLLREILGPTEAMWDAARRSIRRMRRAKADRFPKWRAGDWTKTKEYLRAMKTVGHVG